jgi:CubicO group peptidase (beta-lactamase class C family)
MMASTAPLLTLPAPLTAYVEDERRRADVAGAAVVAFDRDSVRFEQYFGYADLASGTHVGPETLFRAASASKLFTATLLLQEVDAGSVELDAPVNQYLDYLAGIQARTTNG